MYTSSGEQIRDLVSYKSQLWCHHCEKGLFFPVSCVEHADTRPLPDGAGVVQMEDVANVAPLDDEVDVSGSDDDVPQLNSDDMFQADD